MKQEMIKYLETIGITKHYLKRTKEVYNFYNTFLEQEEILDIFVCDYLDGEGVRNYESLWLFTQNYIMEATLFLIQDNFDIAPIKKRVIHCAIEKEKYDFKKANDKSRINVSLRLPFQLTCDFKASKENCDYLRDILLKHIKPNININS